MSKVMGSWSGMRKYLEEESRNNQLKKLTLLASGDTIYKERLIITNFFYENQSRHRNL